jgi:hypothetical protein
MINTIENERLSPRRVLGPLTLVHHTVSRESLDPAAAKAIAEVPVAVEQKVAVTPKIEETHSKVLRFAEEQFQVGKHDLETGRTHMRRFTTKREVSPRAATRLLHPNCMAELKLWRCLRESGFASSPRNPWRAQKMSLFNGLIKGITNKHRLGAQADPLNLGISGSLSGLPPYSFLALR